MYNHIVSQSWIAQYQWMLKTRTRLSADVDKPARRGFVSLKVCQSRSTNMVPLDMVSY